MFTTLLAYYCGLAFGYWMRGFRDKIRLEDEKFAQGTYGRNIHLGLPSARARESEKPTHH